MKMYDFDAMMYEYAKDHLRGHDDHDDDCECDDGDDECECEHDAENVEDEMNELLARWERLPLDVLGGVSAYDYFEAVTDPDELMDAFIYSCEHFDGPPAVLENRMCRVPGVADRLVAAIAGESREDVVCWAMSVLDSVPHFAPPLALYCDLLVREGMSESAREMALERIRLDPEPVKDKLLSFIPKANDDNKYLIAEALIACSHDDRTLEYLKKLFLEGKNIAYVAGLAGKYGDERAAEFLYPALDSCDFVDFIDVRSAIEELGGTVDDDYRDFSDDPTYKKIKAASARAAKRN